MTCISSKSRRA